MSYIGEWIIAGSYDNEKIIDFKEQMKKELPSFSYEEMMKSDSDLNQTLLIKDDGSVFLDTKGDSDGVITGTLKDGIIEFDNEQIPVKTEENYLIFCIDGGFVFKRK
ncbi:MAG: hypothetical protein K6F76_01445 [Clostridiales bacterium]|nr:hypothetical protein [Clostridiales bacterium]